MSIQHQLGALRVSLSDPYNRLSEGKHAYRTLDCNMERFRIGWKASYRLPTREWHREQKAAVPVLVRHEEKGTQYPTFSGSEDREAFLGLAICG